MKKFIFLIAVLFIAGCASQAPAPVRTAGGYTPVPSIKPDLIPEDQAFYKIDEPIQCVPYAREVSGMNIYGNAYTWWEQAATRYECGAIPKVGAVMVLSKTKRNKYGHVAVVKNVIDSRNIEVAHSNWGGDRATRSIIYKRMPVLDISVKNDWSEARFWNYPSRSYGRPYKVSGFIYPDEKK